MSRNLCKNALQEPDVRANGRMSRGRAGCPGSKSEDELEELNFGAEIYDLWAKFDGFRGWNMGKLGGKLDPLETKQIHGSKSTKHHQTNKSQKKLGLFLVGIFEFRTKTTKSSWKTQGRGSKNVINVAHDTKMM